MWRLMRASFSIVVMMVGIILGVIFIEHNRTEVNIQFPFPGVARESGPVNLGIALIVAAAVGMAIALVIAFIASVGMSLYAARLKREIRSMRKEVDSLRNLPLLDEEIAKEDDDDEDDFSTSRSLDTSVGSRWGARTPDVVPDGPVHAGSTAAPIGGDDEDEFEDDRDSDDDLAAADTVPALPLPPPSARKLD
jgi:uncharacterized integral membrane protein